jgi:hypothetical protein
MTLLTKGMGVVKRIMAKSKAGRKDQVLTEIKEGRKKKVSKKLWKGRTKRLIDVEGKKKHTIQDESHLMDVDTYAAVSSAPDKEVKAWLKHKGFKE